MPLPIEIHGMQHRQRHVRLVRSIGRGPQTGDSRPGILRDLGHLRIVRRHPHVRDARGGAGRSDSVDDQRDVPKHPFVLAGKPLRPPACRDDSQDGHRQTSCKGKEIMQSGGDLSQLR